MNKYFHIVKQRLNFLLGFCLFILLTDFIRLTAALDASVDCEKWTWCGRAT